jgi:DNA modification methylase
MSNKSIQKTSDVKKVGINVECPKVYGNSMTLSSCSKCQFYKGLNKSKIHCAYTNDLGDNGKNIHPNNKVNDLKGSEWLYFTKSIFRTSYPSKYSHELRKKHYANKPPQLMKYIIKFFTKPGELVLDPFAGVGGTLLGASLCDRKAIGIELNQDWADIYEQVCKKEGLKKEKILIGDCIEVMSKFKEEGKFFDAIITDPPYSPALDKTLCDGKYGKANRNSNFETFSASEKDFRNSESFDKYFDKIEEAAKLMYDILKEKKYLVVMLRDSYQNSKYIPAGYEVSRRIGKYFVFKGVKIWYQTGAPVRPYGYPFSFVPNIIHHDILIFRKD